MALTILIRQVRDEEAMVSLGRRLGGCLDKGGAIYLKGGLGAGKTTLARGVLQAAGFQGAVKSPTYTLVEPYEINGRHLYHFDLYRLNDPEELEYLGIRDYFVAGNICLVEWPERGEGILPDPDLVVRIDVTGTTRQVSLQATSIIGENVLTDFRGGP